MRSLIDAAQGATPFAQQDAANTAVASEIYEAHSPGRKGYEKRYFMSAFKGFMQKYKETTRFSLLHKVMLYPSALSVRLKFCSF